MQNRQEKNALRADLLLALCKRVALNPEHMTSTIRFHTLLWIGLLLATPAWAANAALVMPAGTMPAHDNIQTGVIDGVLYWRTAATGAPEILRHQTFRVEVRMGDQLLVNVPKTSDAVGHFEIKNIFPHPALQYVMIVEHDGVSRESAPLQLAPGTLHQTRDVVIEQASPAVTDSMPAAAPRALSVTAILPERARLVSVVLTLLVVTLVGVTWYTKSRASRVAS